MSLSKKWLTLFSEYSTNKYKPKITKIPKEIATLIINAKNSLWCIIYHYFFIEKFKLSNNKWNFLFKNLPIIFRSYAIIYPFYFFLKKNKLLSYYCDIKIKIIIEINIYCNDDQNL